MSAKFPNLAICIGTIDDVQIEKENEQIKRLRASVYEEVKSKYDVETLKNNATVRAYRDFYWKLNVDPTKTRPSGEALLRRVLHGDALPQISPVVDAYNLASMKTIIPISGFDKDSLQPPLHVRFAENEEPFAGIGLDKTLALTDRTLVLADEKQVLCIYPYRDSDKTKITKQTKNLMIIGYGAPKIPEEQLNDAVKTTLSYITQVTSGKIGTIKVFNSTPK